MTTLPDDEQTAQVAGAQRRPFRPMSADGGTVPIYRLDVRHPQAEQCARCAVRSSALFGVLDDEGLDRIHAHIVEQNVPADQAVFRQGDQGHALYTVREGVLRLERVTERGERRIVRLVGRGDLIGQEAMLGQRHGDDAVACTPVQLCRIPASLVDELEALEAPLRRELMQRWQAAVDDARDWLADLSTGPARRRMLRLLDRLLGYAGGSDTVWLPRREEMGAMLDMTVETASRLVSQLRRDGVIVAVHARTAQIDMSALRRAVDTER